MQREMSIFEIIRAFIKRYKVLVGMVAIFAFLGAAGSYLTNESHYQSTANLIVGEKTQEKTDEINQINGEPIYEEVIEFGNSTISDQSKKFYSEILERNNFLTEVINNLGLELEPAELKSMIQMEVAENSASLFIRVSSPEIQEVDEIVEEVVEVFTDRVYEITGEEKIRVLENSSEPRLVRNTNIIKNVIIAVIAALALSFIIILVLEYLDDSIDSEEIIERKLVIPVVGRLNNKDSYQEDLKKIRTKLEFSNDLKNKKSFLFSGFKNNSSKITADLSNALAKIEKRVLLIDADFREPRIHQQLSVKNDRGLSNILEKELSLAEVVQTLDLNIDLLTAGDALDDPSEKLSSKKMESFLKEHKKSYDYLLVNGHSINDLTDSLVIARMLDGVVLIVEENETKFSDLKKIKDTLADLDTNISGVIYKKF